MDFLVGMGSPDFEWRVVEGCVCRVLSDATDSIKTAPSQIRSNGTSTVSEMASIAMRDGWVSDLEMKLFHSRREYISASAERDAKEASAKAKELRAKATSKASTSNTQSFALQHEDADDEHSD